MASVNDSTVTSFRSWCKICSFCRCVLFFKNSFLYLLVLVGCDCLCLLLFWNVSSCIFSLFIYCVMCMVSFTVCLAFPVLTIIYSLSPFIVFSMVCTLFYFILFYLESEIEIIYFYFGYIIHYPLKDCYLL